jgi:hypothetical protein
MVQHGMLLQILQKFIDRSEMHGLAAAILLPILTGRDIVMNKRFQQLDDAAWITHEMPVVNEHSTQQRPKLERVQQFVVSQASCKRESLDRLRCSKSSAQLDDGISQREHRVTEIIPHLPLP